jgi:hypothetical protein
MHFPEKLVRDFAICASNEFRDSAENDATEASKSWSWRFWLGFADDLDA